MDDLQKLLTIALAVLAIATAAGFGLQRGRIGQQEKRIETLQGQLADSDAELERQDRRRERAEKELEAYKANANAEVGQLKTDLAALARVVTGEAHWIAIGEKLDIHHDQAEAHWIRAEQIAEEIRDRLPAAPDQGRSST
jgi:hypothetical protein